jgi:hypothetical protein
MGRTHLIVLVVLILIGMAAMTGAVDKRGALPQRVDPDPNSTFEVGNLTSVFPLDTVDVPLNFATSNQVTYIENRINWTDDDLNLVDVIKGPGVPQDTSVKLVVINETDSEVQFKIYSSSPFSITAGQPIAYLQFEVNCFGYGSSTPVDLADNDNYNFYISGGLPYAPVRDNGRIWTAYESYLFLIGEWDTAYSGEQHIPWEVDLWQEIPGQIVVAYFHYDPTVLHFDSVTAGPGIFGGSVSAFLTADTIIVVLPTENPVSPANQQVNIFTLHFGLEDDDDDYVTPITIVRSQRLDECGGISFPQSISGTVTVPAHTAEADLGDIWAYTTATYYDVPFELDSSFPVNDYEFRVGFPAEDIYFDTVVEVAGFTPPTASLDPSDTSVVQINNGSGTDYLPSQLPANVFKLRFRPRSTPSSGTVFDIVFIPSPENEVRYNMDLPGFHTADPLTLIDGSIEIRRKSTGGPGCPALYVWNGERFELDNTILAACDGARVVSDVTDYYLVTKAVAVDADELRFQIREDAQEVSTFRDFDLMVIDHPKDNAIQVTRDGDIISIGQPFSVSWAKDHKGNDITSLITAEDEVPYISKENGWFDVSFGKLGKNQITPFAASIGPIIPKDNRDDDEEALRSAGVRPDGIDKKLKVSIQTADGTWQLISEEDARLEPGQQATVIDPDMIDPDRELVLRYEWERYYEIDVLDFRKAEPFTGDIKELNVTGAVHTKNGPVLHKLNDNIARDPLTLLPGDVIDLAFDASSLQPVGKGEARAYIFVSKGKYEKAGAAAPRGDFALDANVPNPFNPTTRIHYNLPVATQVELKIYDVRGVLVRTLVSEFQAAGENDVTWNAMSDSGQRLASGVYFYQLKTPEFSKTRKMVLLK